MHILYIYITANNSVSINDNRTSVFIVISTAFTVAMHIHTHTSHQRYGISQILNLLLPMRNVMLPFSTIESLSFRTSTNPFELPSSFR